MNLKGGYKILSLVTLVLIASVDGTTATDITDVNTLEQLDSLKEYLDISKQLKPILLRVKPSKEKVVMAELSRVDDVTLMIHAKLDGYELNIVVSFEQDEETLLWSIDDAQYLYVKTVNSEVGIKGLIQADKDILSQIVIEYDEDQGETLYTFPKNVLPITIFDDVSDKVLYFDYIGEFLYKKDGTWLYDGIAFSVSGNRLSMSLAGENPIEITAITYVNLNNDLIAEDWYKILNPSGGTKLYKHYIVGNEELIIISTDSNPITGVDTTKKYEIGNNGVVSMYSNSLGLLATNFSYSNVDGWIFVGTDNQSTSVGIFTDTVTEL